MPYSNEHSCRIREPGEFEDKSFRRIKQGKLSIIIGKLKGKSSTTTQAFRYPKDDWTEASARAHCKAQEGRFEAAASGNVQETMEIKDFDYCDPKDNPMIRTGEED